jgi:histidinol-phosphate aminotransferase
MAGELMGCRIKEVPMRSLTHDLDAFAKAITKRTKLCFIANPNNPTGTYVDAREVSRFMNSIPEDIIVVFDEAYTEYVTAKDYPKMIEYLRRGKRIVILRTLSKIYGLAGLRIGYALAPSSIVELVDRVRPPFNTSAVAQAAACAALDDYAHIKKCSKLNRQGMKYLEGEFHKLGLETIPSQCNFVLVKFGKYAGQINEELLSRGIIVRPLSDYGLGEYLRITIGKPEENRRLVRALRGIL